MATLNYISKIQSYRHGLDSLFEDEIVRNYLRHDDEVITMLTK